MCEALVGVAQQMPMGNGREEQNVLGPLQNKLQYDILAGLVEDTKQGGGWVLIGGDPEPDQPGYFYLTTLVADLPDDNPLVGQEQKGCGISSGDPSESLPREWCAGEGCCGY